MILFCFRKLEFPRFPSFRFWPLCWNRKLGKLGNIFNNCKFQRLCFTWERWKLPRFPSFRFWDLYWYRKLRNTFNTCKFQILCFTWGSWEFLRFPGFWFWPLCWNQFCVKWICFILRSYKLLRSEAEAVSVKIGALKFFYKFHRKTPVLESLFQ